MPSAKVTTQTITTLLVSIISICALQLFEVQLDDTAITLISGAVGWVVGAVAAYFTTETNPPPSSYPHLPPEVVPTETLRERRDQLIRLQERSKRP